MKLRLHHQSLRLRLSSKDLEELKNRGELCEKLTVSPKSQLQYGLQLDKNSSQIEANFNNQKLQVSIPYSVAMDWLQSENISLKEKQTESNLNILIEKDLPCDHGSKE